MTALLFWRSTFIRRVDGDEEHFNAIADIRNGHPADPSFEPLNRHSARIRWVGIDPCNIVLAVYDHSRWLAGLRLKCHGLSGENNHSLDAFNVLCGWWVGLCGWFRFRR